MSESGIIALILGILTVATSGGVIGFLQNRKKVPVEKRDADLAAAEKSQQMALANAADLRTDLDRLRTELDTTRTDLKTTRTDLNTEREHRERLSGRVEGLESHIREQDRTIGGLRAALSGMNAWISDLFLRWDYYRQQPTPPDRPNLNID